MDFHPPVTRPAHSGLKIPLYDNPFFKYDPQQSFSSFPGQKGLVNFTDAVFRLPITDTLSALQSWLFFGLITEIFDALGVVLSYDDFIVEEAGSRYITTKNLRRYLWYCIGNVKNMLFDEVEGTVMFLDESFGRRIDNNEIPNRINSALEIANEVINRILGRGFQDTNLELEALLLSLMCLIETLGDSRDNWDIFPNHYKRVAWPANTVPLLTNLLLTAGWCLNGIRWLHNRFAHMSTLYFVTFFDRRILGRDHRDCTSELCTLDVISKDTYINKHIGPCGCQHVGNELEYEIVEILEKGEIPVLSFLSSTPRPSLTVKSAKEIEVYVAISHVWSDGLGNPHANSLPLCQLLRLQELVNNLYPNKSEQTWFWIDTICVPLTPALRNIAIRRMADVYQNANLVLVLESSLMTSTINASNTETLARIKCSSWSRRLWTFQEGILARRFRLVFRFEDGYFHVRQTFSRLVDDEAFNAMAKSILNSVSQHRTRGYDQSNP